MDKEQFDSIEIYCRRLGHAVPFKYCRSMTSGSPCNLIMDCSFEKIPVEQFLNEHYCEKEINKILAPAPSKISSILELVEKARKHKS